MQIFQKRKIENALVESAKVAALTAANKLVEAVKEVFEKDSQQIRNNIELEIKKRAISPDELAKIEAQNRAAEVRRELVEAQKQVNDLQRELQTLLRERQATERNTLEGR